MWFSLLRRALNDSRQALQRALRRHLVQRSRTLCYDMRIPSILRPQYICPLQENYGWRLFHS